ncbi:MAG: hypothetical protein JNM69_20680, partial [Archangium sp.]|nr:hypothetical protein [Archangium sp.]
MRMTRLSSLVVTALISVAGCRGCGGGPVVISRPDLRAFDTSNAEVGALNFAACSTIDENMQPVRDVFPDIEPIVLSNEAGKASAKAKFTFSGNEPSAYLLRIGSADGGSFAVVQTPYEVDIGVGERITVEIGFAPRKAKTGQTATLTIDDQV